MAGKTSKKSANVTLPKKAAAQLAKLLDEQSERLTKKPAE